jgi:hypothetical protein
MVIWWFPCCGLTVPMLGISCSRRGNNLFPCWELSESRKGTVSISVADVEKVVRGLPVLPKRTTISHSYLCVYLT